ncbi:DAT [Trypoxylus dichotomus]
MTVSTIGVTALWLLADHPQKEDSGNMVQFFFVYILFGIPMVYMQVIMGQYTQMGLVVYRHLIPIGHGLAYVYILLIFGKIVDISMDLSAYLLYFLMIFRSKLDWLICPPEYEAECWTYSIKRGSTRIPGSMKYNNIESAIPAKIENAFAEYFSRVCNESQNSQLLTFYDMMNSTIAFTSIIPEEFELAPTRRKYNQNIAASIGDSYLHIEQRRALPLMIIWGVTLICLVYSTSNHKKMMRVFLYITLSILGVLICGTVLTKGGHYFFETIYHIDSASFTSLATWSQAITNAINLLVTSRGFAIIYGSTLSPTAPSGILSVAIVCLNLLFIVVCTILTFGCYGILKSYSYSDEKDIINLPSDPDFVLYTIIPQAIPHIGLAQLWAFLCYSFLIIMTLNLQMIHLLTIEKCLSDMFPKLLKYRQYVLAFVSGFAFIFGVILNSSGMMIIFDLLWESLFSTVILSSLFTTILVCWVYGVQRICDDIHHLCGSPPARFWKILWYILPAIIIVAATQYFNNLISNLEFTEQIVYFLFLLLFTSPIYVFGIIELLRYIRKGNLLGLFKPTEYYGPPDAEERRVRRTYNPRKEIRCRRRTDKCTHRCLLGNTNLRAFVSESSDGQSVLCLTGD